MDKNLSEFINQIMVLSPGGRWPSSAGDVTIQLKEKAVQLAEQLRDNTSPSAKQINEIAKDIEGLLVTEEIVNSWGQAATNNLIDQLHKLVASKPDSLKK